VTIDLGLAVVAVAVVGTNANKVVYDFSGRGYLGGTAGVVTVTKSF